MVWALGGLCLLLGWGWWRARHRPAPVSWKDPSPSAFFEQYDGTVSLPLPSGEVVVRGMSLREAARFLPIWDRALTGHRKAIQTLMREFPKAVGLEDSGHLLPGEFLDLVGVYFTHRRQTGQMAARTTPDDSANGTTPPRPSMTVSGSSSPGTDSSPTPPSRGGSSKPDSAPEDALTPAGCLPI